MNRTIRKQLAIRFDTTKRRWVIIFEGRSVGEFETINWRLVNYPKVMRTKWVAKIHDHALGTHRVEGLHPKSIFDKMTPLLARAMKGDGTSPRSA